MPAPISWFDEVRLDVAKSRRKCLFCADHIKQGETVIVTKVVGWNNNLVDGSYHVDCGQQWLNERIDHLTSVQKTIKKERKQK